jgi:hypothetical protein
MKASELLLQSVEPFDAACMQVRQMEAELDALRAFHDLFKEDQQALFEFFGLLAIERFNAVALSRVVL